MQLGTLQKLDIKYVVIVSWQVQEESEEYDVYVNQPEPLDVGEEKHVISAFVADESGIINRVAGVFARRGARTI